MYLTLFSLLARGAQASDAMRPGLLGASVPRSFEEIKETHRDSGGFPSLRIAFSRPFDYPALPVRSFNGMGQREALPLLQSSRLQDSVCEGPDTSPRHAGHRIYANPSAAFILILLLWVLVGCRSTGLEHLDGAPKPAMTAGELAALLNTRSETLHSMRALLQLEARGSIIPVSRTFDMSLSYMHPSFMRLQGFDSLGRTLFDMTTDSRRFSLYLPTHAKVIAGSFEHFDGDLSPEQSEKFGRMLRLFRAISQTVVSTPIRPEDRISLYDEGARYRLEITALPEGTGLTRHVWFAGPRLSLVKETVFDISGQPLATVEFGDFRPLSASKEVLHPYLMTIHDVEHGGRVTLTFREIIANPAFIHADFDLLPWQGTTSMIE